MKHKSRKNKAVIALMTDYGLNDNYVGILKGVILKINPDCQIADLCHSIAPHDIPEGALMLKSGYSYYPKGTIFVAVIDPSVGSKRSAIIMQSKDYTFIAPDNGLLSLVADEMDKPKIYKIKRSEYLLTPISNTFHGRDIFAPVAAHLSAGVPPTKCATRIKSMVRFYIPKPKISKKDGKISGEVTAIDHFGNLITNIEQEHLAKFRGRPKVTIKDRTMNRLVESYVEVKKGLPLAIIGSKGYLEISISQGSAAETLMAFKGQRVQVEFG